MLRTEILEAFDAANIHGLIAEQHKADWAQVTDVHNEIEFVKGHEQRRYMLVRWFAQNGHLVMGDTKIFGERTGGFDEDQLTLLGAVALEAGEPRHRYAG